MVLDASWLNTAFISYGSRVSGAIQGKELCPPLHLSVVAIEKRAYGQSTYLFKIYIENASVVNLQKFIQRINFTKQFLAFIFSTKSLWQIIAQKILYIYKKAPADNFLAENIKKIQQKVVKNI